MNANECNLNVYYNSKELGPGKLSQRPFQHPFQRPFQRPFLGQLKYLDRLWLEGNKMEVFPEALPLAAELDDLRIGQNSLVLEDYIT